MKKHILKISTVLTLLITQAACRKTYTCQCSSNSSNGSASTVSTSQVKALSKEKAKTRCSGTCNNGVLSVK